PIRLRRAAPGASARGRTCRSRDPRAIRIIAGDCGISKGRNQMRTNREAALKLFVVLNRTVAALRQHAEADVARHGLTLIEFAVMEALFHRGDMPLGEVQKRILVTSGGMTYIVDRLVEQGYVERKPCAT